METTYLIDTNILVYAYNEDVEFHEEALKILENAPESIDHKEKIEEIPEPGKEE